MLTKVDETPLRPADGGLVPEGDGWFILNVADAQAYHHDRFGSSCRFEGESFFPQLGINVRVLQPGQPNALYHRESGQEDFLVIAGECIAIVEEQERRMRAGDLLHCPPGTAHILIGGGEGPCVIVMAGARREPEELLYPVSEAAARHGASVKEETPDPRVAYADAGPRKPGTLGMPW